MSEVATERIGEEAVACMTNMCNDLFKQWSVDLNFGEKEIWLWNASVEMYKIKHRRPLAC